MLGSTLGLMYNHLFLQTTELLYNNLCSKINVQVMASIQEHLNQVSICKSVFATYGILEHKDKIHRVYFFGYIEVYTIVAILLS